MFLHALVFLVQMHSVTRTLVTTYRAWSTSMFSAPDRWCSSQLNVTPNHLSVEHATNSHE